MKPLTIVSLDSHAQPPPSAWPKYLDKRFHDYLPAILEENDWFVKLMGTFVARSYGADQLDRFDFEHAIRNGGGNGVWDSKVRIAEMDREGIAAEYITNGDPRACGLFYQASNQTYPDDVCQAGVKAYHRWLADEFGAEKDRLKLIGIPNCGPWRNMEELLAEVDWLADNGYVAVNVPTFTPGRHDPPIYDTYWDPYWAKVLDRGLVLWMHAGYGEAQGELGKETGRLYKQIKKQGLSIDDLAGRLNSEVFDDGAVFASLKPRRALWQMAMGGVFDRFPKLKMVQVETYADWMPETLDFFDKVYDENRANMPAKRKPSEYWADNCMTCMSFMRMSEVVVRHKVGINTVAFGRDYPHIESTWPNTKAWLHEVFKGVPESEVHAILTENPIRFLELDRAKLDAIAARIKAPSMEDIMGAGAAAGPDLVKHFDQRSRFLAPSEGGTRLDQLQVLVRDDLWRVGVGA